MAVALSHYKIESGIVIIKQSATADNVKRVYKLWLDNPSQLSLPEYITATAAT